MKRFLAFLLSVVVITGVYGQSTDAQLTTQNNTDIRTKPYSPTRAANMFEAVIDGKKSWFVDGVASGTDTYTVSVNSAVTAYTENVVLRIKFTNANTIAIPTLDVNSIGPVEIKSNAGDNLFIGWIMAGGTYDLCYDGTNLRMVSLNGYWPLSGLALLTGNVEINGDSNILAMHTLSQLNQQVNTGGIFYQTQGDFAEFRMQDDFIYLKNENNEFELHETNGVKIRTDNDIEIGNAGSTKTLNFTPSGTSLISDGELELTGHDDASVSMKGADGSSIVKTQLLLSSEDARFIDSRDVPVGIEYDGFDYDALTSNSLVPKTYVTTNMQSGHYLPTLFNTTNISASTADTCQWMQVFNTVTVSGKVTIDATAAVATELGFSIPISTGIFIAEDNLAGTAASAVALTPPVAVRADVANVRASFVFTATSLTNDSYFFTFTYRLIE